MKRFFKPSYIFFSSKLALKAYRLKRNHLKNTPISCIKELVQPDVTSCSYNHTDSYHAFSYFDHDTCQNYYQSYSNHVTVEIIKAMVYYNESNRNDSTFVQMVDEWIDKYATVCDKYCKFNLSFTSERYTFKDEFLSGIVQGKAISLLVRAYAVSKDKKYQVLAQKTLEACQIPIEDNGAFREINGLPWVEEYPDISKPSMVLNGHLFLLVGLIDYATFTSSDEYSEFTSDLLSSTLAYLPHYRYGDDLLYELGRWKFCNVHYLGIMTPLFEHLYQLTRIELFNEYGKVTHRSCDWNLFNWLIENQES